MRDFTISAYKELVDAFTDQDYSIQTYSQFIENPKEKAVILRHDADKAPKNSLALANLLSESGRFATFYFRAAPPSWNEDIIRTIAGQGHEIGYHYENMDTSNGNIDKAFMDFMEQLSRFRDIASIKTICMHGSPRSRWDNRDLWKKYDYRTLKITGEPYLDIDFSKVFYLTDTGRCWDGYKKSIRDKIPEQQDRWAENGLVFHSTRDIIRAVCKNLLPQQIMVTIHPQRWNDDIYHWTKELALQNIKNQLKYFSVKSE
jgi:hypothetical protein